MPGLIMMLEHRIDLRTFGAHVSRPKLPMPPTNCSVFVIAKLMDIRRITPRYLTLSLHINTTIII